MADLSVDNGGSDRWQPGWQCCGSAFHRRGLDESLKFGALTNPQESVKLAGYNLGILLPRIFTMLVTKALLTSAGNLPQPLRT